MDSTKSGHSTSTNRIIRVKQNSIGWSNQWEVRDGVNEGGGGGKRWCRRSNGFFLFLPPLFARPSPAAAGAVMKRPFPTDDREREIFFFFFSLCSSSFWLRGGGPVSNFFSSHWWTCASSTLVQLSTWPVVNAVGYIESRSPWSLTRPSVATISCDSLHRHHTTDGWRTSSKCVAITKVRGRRSNSSRLSSVFIKSISSATNGFDDKFAQPRATGRLLEWLEQSGFGPSSRG